MEGILLTRRLNGNTYPGLQLTESPSQRWVSQCSSHSARALYQKSLLRLSCDFLFSDHSLPLVWLRAQQGPALWARPFRVAMRRKDWPCQGGPKLFSGLTGSWDPQTLNTCGLFLAAYSVRAIMPGGSPLAWPMAIKETPVGIKYKRDSRPLFFIYWKGKKCHFSYVDSWEPNFRNVWFLKSFLPAFQSSSRKLKTGTISLPYKIIKYMLKPVTK